MEVLTLAFSTLKNDEYIGADNKTPKWTFMSFQYTKKETIKVKP